MRVSACLSLSWHGCSRLGRKLYIVLVFALRTPYEPHGSPSIPRTVIHQYASARQLRSIRMQTLEKRDLWHDRVSARVSAALS